MTHGGRRAKPLANPERSELFQAWEADLGADLSTGQRVVLRRAAEADRICQTAYTYLVDTRETLTSPRVQKVLATLATHASTVFRAAQALGLERKARPLPTLREALDAVEADG